MYGDKISDSQSGTTGIQGRKHVSRDVFCDAISGFYGLQVYLGCTECWNLEKGTRRRVSGDVFGMF